MDIWILATQGTNKLETQDVICTIYDMASNTYEWITENCIFSDYPCTARGGYGEGRGLYTTSV